MNKKLIAKGIIEKLHQNGHDAVLAGGCVRDEVRGMAPRDYDIATSATPEQVQKLFNKTIPVGVQFGVVIVLEQDLPVEVATFRSEGKYIDGRHPTEVKFTSLEQDAQRRDFTVNGLYFDFKTNQVVDLVGGLEDISKKIIRSIGDPRERFQEDHLRILRAIRFAIQLDFEIDRETFEAGKTLAAQLKKVSPERIRDEISKSLTYGDPGKAIRLFDQMGVIPYIMPELETLKGVEQPSEYHPEGDVWIHTLMLLDQLKAPPLELVLGALLHDIAKPDTFVRAEDRIRFHGHDRIGAEKSELILKRLCFSNHQTDIICSLVREHLRFKDAFQMRVATLKRFFRLERFDWHLELHRIDCLASHGKLDAYHFCKSKYEEFLKEPPPPTRIITGEDLIALGYQPGPTFKIILDKIEDEILEGRIHTKEEGLEYLKINFKKDL